ncbi:hypothetical protein E4T38_00986 [Aureobasidium subglaciale]|nr:hypothetical protein E4T38_00986 [Aureobasidium subglaciale]KAI5230641.1 hypothetical protein E4T40_00987 [Aureobasidium subglaciale]KAI5233802.1 hypothetical protein E4T41_00985 [Aureobasidium subglaciale]KAI5267325.1 hypothetical protein E4T46_00985 [Aureobasidium subglaciale]
MAQQSVSNRTNTLDSLMTSPTPSHLNSRKGSSAQLSVISGQSGLSRRDDYESASEMDAMAHASHPGRSNAGSPVPPQTPSAGSATANLSGLVCNVHRTTGREPHPLVGATTTILGDKLYVFGGRKISKSRPTLTSDLYELDLPRRHWSKIETKGDVPPPRYFHSVCSLGDNKLVCYGGMSPEGGPAAQNESPDAQVSVMSDVHVYDIPSHTWTKIGTGEAPQGRYAHCAAILPSGAVFASSNAPLSAIHHNPSGPQPNSGSIGVDLDGRGGAEMIVVGGQDSNNQYIEQISVFNLRSLKWTSTKPMSGRSCGAYRSVVTPLVSMESTKVGAGHEASIDDYDDDDEDDDSDLNSSGSAMLIYTNYNFLDVKLELQVRNRDGTLVDKQMQGTVTPPGLRFPTGGVIGNNFVVAGTFLTSSKQEFSLWALDLRSLTWARIDSGSSIFSQGSWNRGVLWERRNSFIILGNRKRNLVDDYNNRRLNFNNMCVVQLEAFGLYDNPRKACPTSDYISSSAPQYQPGSEGSAGGRRLYSGAEELGETMLQSRELCDMDFLAIDGTRLPVNSRLIGRRWGPFFNQLVRESAGPNESGETATLRPATMASRNSSITITPTLTSNGSTLTANSVTGTTVTLEPADVRNMPPNSRPRTLYLPHTVPALQALIHYLYTGSLPQQPSHLATPQIFCSLLQLARPYEIDGLAEEVTERLHETLDGRNAAAIFNAAAMAAGGGQGVVFKEINTSVHPPRVQSLAGIEALSINGSGGAGGRNPLRVDTEIANGRTTRTTLRGESLTEEDEDVPDSASTTGSAYSVTSSRQGGRDDDEIWDGGQSHVIGLQKRGLRGLMEGRRIRERGRSDGTGAASSVTGSSSVAGGSVASGSMSGPSDPKGLGLGIS